MISLPFRLAIPSLFAAVCIAPVTVQARVDFSGEFAPAETWVKAPEKPLRDDICLNGAWQFQPVALPPNFKDGRDPTPELPAPTADGWDKVPLRVPSTWNANVFADHKGQAGDFRCFPSYPQAWETVEMGWLKRGVDVPAAWKGRRVVLHFAAAAGDIQVQVNGKPVDHRFDIFFPFDIDVTDQVQYGASNEIVIGVRKPSLFDVQGQFGRRTYQGGSFWGQFVVGLWQDVDLVALPVVHVSDVFVQPLVDQKVLKAEVTVRNDGDAPAVVSVSGAAYPWINQAGKTPVEAPVPKWSLGAAAAASLPPVSVTLPPHGEQTVTLFQQLSGSELKPWSPDDPELYGLLVDVKNGDQAIDRKYTRFGWRQFTFDGAKVLLNGQRLILRGDSWHFLGVPQLTRRYPWAWFSALHDAHANAVRLHAQPYPEFYLDVADEMGICVLDETAIWASDGGPKLDSDDFWKDTEAHVENLVRRDRNHPAVFGWSVCNEVKPIVQNVFHNPPGMYDKLLGYYTTWLGICTRLDPTRPWVSADGDEDGGGKLPTYMTHYGGIEKAVASGKPWGVGETSGAYYMTPEQVAKNNGEGAYLSFLDRMKGIASDCYKLLLDQRKNDASYRSVFNLVWYGLQPLALGQKDTTQAPTTEDGVFFPPLVDGKPGMQPERLGPYCTTLNPGYDPNLPPYATWPMFDAIKAGNAEPPDDFPAFPDHAIPPVQPVARVSSVDVVAGTGGKLRDALVTDGIVFENLKPSGTAAVLFVDGIAPPGAEAAAAISQTLSSGGTVVVWGVSKDSLPALNALLPAPVELTDRQASSLVPAGNDPLTASLKPSSLYFSELSPPIILDGGLGGPLVAKGTVLLEACNTDWMRWNKQAENAKTAMVVRSERETKPSGAALVAVKVGNGRLLVCNLPAAPKLFKGQVLVRALLANLGIPLQAPVDVGEPFLKTGQLIRALAVGRLSSPDETATKEFVSPKASGSFRDNNEVGNKRWHGIAADNGVFNLRGAPLDGPAENAVSYITFWLMSPRPLDNLLLEPNVPKLDLNLHTDDAVEVFLNGKSFYKGTAGGVASGLPLQQGWNSVLVRFYHAKGDDKFSAELVSSIPEFLNDLKSSQEKP